MEQIEDYRIIKTKSAIKKSIADLLEEKSFDQISISEIVKKAGITRKSFYNHYQDKYDFVEKYQKELAKEIHQLTKPYPLQSKAFFYEIFSFLESKGKLLEGLLSSRGSLEIQEFLKDLMKQSILEAIKTTEMYSSRNENEVDILVVFLANATFGVVQYWINSRKQIGPQEMALILENIFFNHT